MPLTNVNLNRIDGSVGSIGTASISNIKNPSSGSNNIVLNSDGTTTLTPSNIIKSGTAQATTSGTAIDFTGIPSWVKRITVMFNGVSTNGTSNPLVQIGAGSVATSGYTSTSVTVNSSSSTAGGSSTSGFIIFSGVSTSLLSGQLVIASFGSNIWTCSFTLKQLTTNVLFGGGDVTLSGTLDRLRLTTVNGTDTFDAGSVNILYEG